VLAGEGGLALPLLGDRRFEFGSARPRYVGQRDADLRRGESAAGEVDERQIPAIRVTHRGFQSSEGRSRGGFDSRGMGELTNFPVTANMI
jgi:hypothetical protein